MSNPYFKSSAMSWSGSKRKKVGESRISLSSPPKSDNQSNSDFRSPATVLAHGAAMNNFNMFANETNNTLLQNISEKEILDKVNGIESICQDYCQWLISQSIVTIDDGGNTISKPKHKVGTQKQYIGGTIKFLEKKYKNIEMLKESKRNESGTWYSEMKMGHDMKASARFISAGLAISSRTTNIRREVVIAICRYLARLNTMYRFLKR